MTMSYVSYSLDAQSSVTRLERVPEDVQHSGSAAEMVTSVDSRRRSSLVSQIVFPQADCASCFPGPTRHIEPLVLGTSHDLQPSREFLHGRPNLTYPSLVSNLRWNPYVETVSEEHTRDHGRSCPCDVCNGPLGAPHHPITATMKNITSFCNQYTMTPRVVDAHCNARRGSAPPLPRSDAGGSSHASRRSQTVCVEEAICPPIMKLSKCGDIGECLPRRRARPSVPGEIGRDIDHDSSSVWSFCRIRQRGSREDCGPTPSGSGCRRRPIPQCDHPPCNRRPIYNEGISDNAASCWGRRESAPAPPCPAPLPPDNYIPYAHTAPSRYHNRCAVEPPILYRGGCGVPCEARPWGHCPRRLLHRPDELPPSSVRVPSCHHKVLVSDRNVDSYMKHDYHNPTSREHIGCRSRSGSRHRSDCCRMKSGTRLYFRN